MDNKDTIDVWIKKNRSNNLTIKFDCKKITLQIIVNNKYTKPKCLNCCTSGKNNRKITNNRIERNKVWILNWQVN